MTFEHIDYVQRDSLLSSPPHGSKPFPPGSWILDPSASDLRITTRLFGCYSVGITLRIREGVAEVDERGWMQRMSMSLLAGSATSGNKLRDRHLRGPGYLDAENFPIIDFHGTATGDKIDGAMTLKGHRVQLRCTATEASLIDGERAALVSYGTTDRRHIGLDNKSLWCIGHELSVELRGTGFRA